MKSSKMDGIWGNSLSKSQAKMNYTAKREQNRKFGEYHGEDGLEGNAQAQSIWQHSPCKFLHLPSSFPQRRHHHDHLLCRY